MNPESYVTQVHIVNAPRFEFMVGALVRLLDSKGDEVKQCGKKIVSSMEGYWIYCNERGASLQITQRDECLYTREITVYGMLE